MRKIITAFALAAGVIAMMFAEPTFKAQTGDGAYAKSSNSCYRQCRENWGSHHCRVHCQRRP